MISVAEVVQNIYRYLRDDLSLDSFRDWMVQAELYLEESPEHDPAREFVWQLEAYYAELSDGIVDVPSWKKLLRQLAEDQRPGSISFVVASLTIDPEHQVLSFGTASPTANSIQSELALAQYA